MRTWDTSDREDDYISQGEVYTLIRCQSTHVSETNRHDPLLGMSFPSNRGKAMHGIRVEMLPTLY